MTLWSFPYPSAGAFHIRPMEIAPAIPNAIATGNTESHPPVSAIDPNNTPETTELAYPKIPTIPLLVPAAYLVDCWDAHTPYRACGP